MAKGALAVHADQRVDEGPGSMCSVHRLFYVYLRIVDAETWAHAVDSAILDENAGAISNVIIIFQAAPFTNRAVPQSGSRIAVDPKDGNLFVAVGDRSTADPLPLQAQHLDTYLGKVIHITPDGKPAPGNPSLGLPGTWSMGHVHGINHPGTKIGDAIRGEARHGAAALLLGSCAPSCAGRRPTRRRLPAHDSIRGSPPHREARCAGCRVVRHCGIEVRSRVPIAAGDCRAALVCQPVQTDESVCATTSHLD